MFCRSFRELLATHSVVLPTIFRGCRRNALRRLVAVNIEPLFLELDPLAAAGGHVGGQRDDGVGHGRLGAATGLVLRWRIADAPGPVLQFLGIAAADFRPAAGALAAAVGAPLAWVSSVGPPLPPPEA